MSSLKYYQSMAHPGFWKISSRTTNDWLVVGFLSITVLQRQDIFQALHKKRNHLIFRNKMVSLNENY